MGDLNELPQGWKWVKLDDICGIARGASPRPIDSFLTNDANGVNWIKISDATASNKYVYETKEKITLEGAKHSRVVNVGDFILSNSMSFGKPYIMGTTGCIHDGWLLLETSDVNELDKEFLYYVLSSDLVYLQLKNFASGATVKNINIDIVKKIKIPLPPFSQQRQIAAKLKAQLAEVETARKALEIQENDVNKLEIQLLESIFTQSTPEKILKIGDVTVTTSGSTPSRDKKEYWQDGCYAWVKTGEVVNKPIFKTEESISEKALKECSLTLLPPKTVLIAMYGQGKTRGQSAVLEIPATTNQACFAILPNETFYPEYLQYWLKNSYSNLRALSEGRGGNQANLNGAMLKDFTVPFISKDKQIKMVDTINTMLNEMEKVKDSIQATKEEIASLPNRLLAQAFAPLTTAKE